MTATGDATRIQDLGRLLAEQSRGGEDLRYLDIDTTPILARFGEDDMLFVASYEGGIYGLDAASGARSWVNDAATGVTDGSIVSGIKREVGYLTTETVLMRSKTGSVRHMIYRNPTR